MSNPSLLCVPYRFKTSKLYSQIPDSGLGDFTVTRSASNSATRVNAAGLIETVADNVPRLDYPLGGITAGCPALLVEPSAVNYLLRSQEFDNASWGKNVAAINTSIGTNGIEANVAISPDGTQNADRVNFLLQTDPDLGLNQNYAAATSTQTYNTSIWFKGEGTNIGKQIKVQMKRTSGGTFVGTTATITLTSGWVRFASSAITLGASNSGVQIIVSSNDATNALIWGAQLEQGSVATSYIPTTTAAITRGAETISKTGVSSLIGQTQGTIYCEFAYFGRPISRSGPLYLRQASLRGMSINADSIGTGITFGSRNDGGDTFITLVPGALQLGTYYKIAIGYDAGNTPAGGQQANGVVAYVNGVQVATGTLRVPDAVGLSEFRMYSANAGSDTEIPNIRIRAHSIYPTRLTNAQLQSLTQ